MNRPFCLGILAGLLCLSPVRSQTPADLGRKLQGTWEVAESSGDGRSALRNGVLTTVPEFKGGKFTFKDDLLRISTTKDEESGRFEIDESDTADGYRGTSFTRGGKKVRGEFRFTETGLELLFDPSGKLRSGFAKAKPDTHRIISLRLKRAAEGAEPVKPVKLTEAHKKWAKSVAEDFLNAGLLGKQTVVSPLVTEELKKAMMSLFSNYDRESGKLIYIEYVYTGFSIDSEQASPDDDELTFKGKLTGKAGGGEFTVRVTRDTDGKWRVRFFLWALPTKK